MISRYHATLNGVGLDAISPKIYIQDISYLPPGHQRATFSVARRDGGRILNRYKEKAGCTITFVIREYNPNKRQSICQSVCAWARDGGVLKTSDRQGQQLNCVCETLPYIASAHKWTDPLSITFSAYVLPYWQDDIQTIASATGTRGSKNIFVPGSAPEAYLSARIVAGSALTWLSLSTATTGITLNNLSLPAGGTILIDYDENMVQRIRQGNTSILGKRVGDDDLIVTCGKVNTFAYDCSGSMTVTMMVRGLWE